MVAESQSVDGRSATDTRRSVWPHLLLLLVGVSIAWPLLDLDAVFIADEGTYAVQERALARGGWDVGYAFAAADPDHRFLPYHGAVVGEEDRVVAYSAHPLWPMALRASTKAFGVQFGLRALGVASFAGAAVVAWSLADALGRRDAAPWSFWLVAASPVLANAWITWAHAPSAAVSGLLILGVLRSFDSRGWLVAAAATAGTGVLLRSEGLLWAIAVGMSLLVLCRDRRGVRAAAAVVAGASVAYAAEQAWRTALIGDIATTSDIRPRGADATWLDRLDGLRMVLVDGGFGSSSTQVLGAIVLVLTVAGTVAASAWRVDRPPSRALTTGSAAPLLFAAAVALALRIVIEPSEPVPGILVAAPVLALAALAFIDLPAHRWILGAAALFIGAVGLAIYPEGGSLQWGGRFLSPIVVALAALAAAAITTLGRWLTNARARGLRAACGALLLVQGLGALLVPDAVRGLSEGPVEQVTSLGPDVLIAGGRQIARLDWDGWPDRCWIAVPEPERSADVRAVVQVLERSGVSRAGYAGLAPEVLERAGATVVPSGDGGEIGIIELQPSGQLPIAPPYGCGDD